MDEKEMKTINETHPTENMSKEHQRFEGMTCYLQKEVLPPGELSD